MKWLLVLALVAGCKKKAAEPPPPVNNEPPIPAAELQRGEDACKAYIDKACKCAETVPAAKPKCDAAQAFPAVLKMSTELTMSKDSVAKDVKQGAMTIRKTVAECIQETAQLPTLGCN
ncbi:MAG: hypothetical protein M4D80_40085 [Myxococcota bacterium]|nr:hypothetical protein [Myxococcota bacterium]